MANVLSRKKKERQVKAGTKPGFTITPEDLKDPEIPKSRLYQSIYEAEDQRVLEYIDQTLRILEEPTQFVPKKKRRSKKDL